MDFFIYSIAVTHVLRVHLWDKKEKWSYKTGDLLKEVKFTSNFLRTEQEKSDLLIEVAA